MASEAYADGSDDDEGVEDEDEDDDEEGYDDLENSELMLEQEDVNITTNPLRCCDGLSLKIFLVRDGV